MIRLRAASLMMCVGMLAGCQGSGSGNSSKADKAQDYKIILANHPPFSARIQTAGKIQIYDFDDKKVVLKTTKVPAGALVTINPMSIAINAVMVSHDRLDRRHTYEIRQFK